MESASESTTVAQQKFAPLYLSHGSPSFLIDTKHPTHHYFKQLGKTVGKPKAVVVFSGHWESSQIEVTASTKVIYDFYGFPAAMYRYHWLAPEDPTLAHRVVDLLKQANFDTVYNDDRGLDHGTWVPLALMYPDADVPVVQVTLHKSLSLAKHIELGRALRPLIDEGVLIVGSGSSTHNLRELRFGGIYSGESDDWVESWEEDLRKIIENEDLNEREKQLLDIVNHSYFRRAHPRAEHFVPIAVTAGAGGKAKRVHYFSGGNLAVAQYQFDPIGRD